MEIKLLSADYPQLFDKMPVKYGIQCEEGWLPLLQDLCYLIEHHENHIHTYRKYHPSAYIGYINLKFSKIKQKFGGLRVHYDGGDEYIRGLVSMTEYLSLKHCEKCGKAGSMHKKSESGFVQTLCTLCKE